MITDLPYTVRSEEEIDTLKADWLDDPCWDIEDTRGFEVWHDELLAWRKESEAVHELEERERVGEKTAELGINATLLEYIEQLERRIAALEAAQK